MTKSTSSTIDPLIHNVPIVDEKGCPTPVFQRQWLQARATDQNVVETDISVIELQDLVAANTEAIADEIAARTAADATESATRSAADTTMASDIADVTADLTTHEARTDNPHNVTATQVDAYTKSEVDTLLAGLGLSRATVNLVTGSLASGATEVGMFDMSCKVANLIRVSSDRGGYLVLYQSAAARDDDARALPATEDVNSGEKALAEFAFPNGGGGFDIGRAVLLTNAAGSSTDCYYRFYNGEASTGVTTIALVVLPQEI